MRTRSNARMTSPIEKVMVKRSAHFKLALAVIVLLLVLLAFGAAIQSLWIAPLIILAVWIAIRFGLGSRTRKNSA